VDILRLLPAADAESAARGAADATRDVGTTAERGGGQAARGATDTADNVGGALQRAAEETRDVHGVLLGVVIFLRSVG
jgi:hypothetical protein